MTRSVPTFFLLFSLAATLAARQDQPRPRLLQYNFTAEQQLSYTLQNDMDINETDVPQGTPRQRAGSVAHTMEYAVGVDSGGTGGVPAVLRVKIRRYTVSDGNPDHDFDSANASQMAAAKTSAGCGWCAATISSISTVEVMQDGKIGKVRLLDFDTGYGETVGSVLNKVVDEVSHYIAFPLSTQAVSAGQSWTGAVPVKFLGGPLSGNFFELPGRFQLERTGEISGEKVAWITISLASQPRLDLTEESVRDARLEFHVDHLNGTAVFSLDRGVLVQYEVAAGTHIQVTVGNQTLDDHKMEYRIRVTRTGSPR